MIKETAFFKINDSIGGNQDWFDSLFMRMGGCAICTALDVSINLKIHHDIDNIYPYDINSLSIDNYVRFSNIMKPYLKPRFKGIDSLEIYLNGYSKYLKDNNITNINLCGLSQDKPVNDAKQAIIQYIDQDYVIPFLLLRHNNYQFKDFIWHWFLIIGYKIENDIFYIKVSTYSREHWFKLEDIWDSGFKQKGGLILINHKEKK